MKHLVGFSGGIDSQRALLWVRRRFPAADIIPCNSTAGGWEHELTTAFVAEYSARIFPVVSIVARVKDLWETEGFAETKGLDGDEELTFERLIQLKKRPPARTNQFCTVYLKLIPQRRWIRAAFGPGGPYEGEEYIRYTGVRRDESDARADTQFETWDEFFDCPKVCPNFDLTKQQCFDEVRAAGEFINPLYTLGFARVGCAPCINSSKDDITNWSERFPGYLETKVGGLEARTGITFFPPVIPMRRGDPRHNDIHAVVRWARSARGGRQDIFPILHERAACESKYGLCE